LSYKEGVRKMELTTVVTGAWNTFATKIMAFIPMLIGAIIIFVAGLILAKLVKARAVKLLKLVRFDSAGEKTGVKDFLDKGNITKTPSIPAILVVIKPMLFISDILFLFCIPYPSIMVRDGTKTYPINIPLKRNY
jgi:NADH:ubiquinone oxidoreductase subunit 3 (subunit A)